MTTLGPYTLLRRLGAGGMGEVWIARRPALGGAAKLVAIKTVLPDKASNPESRRMFLDEARLSMLMSNSNIVQVFDADETADGTCYMAMEYVEGIDLARLTESLRIRGELLSHSAIAYIIGEILKALAYAHDLNVEGIRHTIVHRDISPQNVMISVSGEIKVMDFGIARLSSEETSGTFIRGKLRYMPPEQFTKGVRAPTLDLFAVGALLHELLDGQRFRGGDFEEPELIGMCVRGIVPPLTCPPERVPAVFEQLRKGLLEPEARNRIPSARAAHRLLSQWPGDRDAKFEFEEIVQRVLGHSSSPAASESTSSSGVTFKEPEVAFMPPAESAAMLSPTPPAVHPAAVPESISPLASRPTSEHEVTATEILLRTDPDAGPQRQGPGPSRAEESTGFRVRDKSVTHVLGRNDLPTSISDAKAADEPKPNRSKWLTLALMLLAMSFAMTTVGVVLGWWSDDEPDPSGAAPPPPLPSESERPSASIPATSKVPPDLQPAAESQPTEPTPPEPASPEPSPTEPASPEPSPNELTPVEPTTPAPAPKSPSPKPVLKTSVTVTAAGVWAQVKIGGKELTFDRMNGIKQVMIKLKPGEYTVSFRDDAEVAWQPLGTVRIPEGEAVTLDIKAGKVTVGK